MNQDPINTVAINGWINPAEPLVARFLAADVAQSNSVGFFRSQQLPQTGPIGDLRQIIIPWGY